MDLEIASRPEVKELTEQTETLLAVGANFTVRTPAEYQVAGTELTRVKAAQRRLEEVRQSITRPMDAAKRAVLDFFRGPEEKLARAEAGIKRAMVGYQTEQERIRREEQRKAEEQARRQREAAERAAAEARCKAEEAAAELRRKAEEEAAAGRAAEAARLAARADQKLQKAETKAAGLEQQAATIVAPVIQREPPKVAGIATREVWRFEITDPNAVPREYLVVDESKIRRVVGALKGDTKIPGVRVWSEKALAAGAA